MHAERPDQIDEATLTRVLESANIPTLLMCLVHLTGDVRWLDSPYRPTRSRGVDVNDSGGLADADQAQVRKEAVAAILKWIEGNPIEITEPSEELLGRMLDTSNGEEVTLEYRAMAAMEFQSVDPLSSLGVAPTTSGASPASSETMSAIVIGAGISGLLASLRLKTAGIPHIVVEKAGEVGGTWRDNIYPGAGVDTPSYLYSYSFFPRDWSRHYAKQEEVLEYLKDFVDHYGLREFIRFNTEVEQARYDESQSRWEVTLRSGDGEPETVTAEIVISAVGLLSRPSVPDIPGRETFDGEIFHSAEWPAGVSAKDKRVAVIGTGASAMQIIPGIVNDAAAVKVFQRSPQWIAPAPNYNVELTGDTHWLMRHVPYYYEWYRLRLAWIINDRIHSSLRIDPTWDDAGESINATNQRHRQHFVDYIVQQLDGRVDLQEKVIPTYPPFGKRMLLDNGWFNALKQPHVDLIVEDVVQIDRDGVRTADGSHHEVDMIVLATGFQAQKYLFPMDIIGKGGSSLEEVWDGDDARAYLGMTVPDFPNLFILYGPNTNAAGGSYVFLAECQTRYVVELLDHMRAEGIRSIEPRRDVHDQYNERVDELNTEMIWSFPKMSNYYRNSRGRVVTNLPWRVVEYWDMTRQAQFDDYQYSDSGSSAEGGSHG